MITIKLDSNEERKESSGKSKIIEVLNNGKEKEIYFIILYERKEKEKPEDFVFTKYDIIPKLIYEKELVQKKNIFMKKFSNLM